MARPTPAFRCLSLAAALAAWCLVAVGGIVRITESGLGCPDWPLCSGRVIPKSHTTAIIEFSHRVTAAVTIALVVAVAILAWRSYRSRRDVFLPAAGALLLVPVQALLGAVVVWLELPSWIVGVHFVVGMVFLAATVLAAVSAWRPPARRASPGFVRLAWTTAAAGLVLVSAGAAVVAAHADEACGKEWPACNGAFAAGGGDAAIQVAHRTLAYAVAFLALALALAAWRRRGPRLAGTLPLLTVLGQMAIGITLVVVGEESGAHQTLGGLHVGGAGAVWAALVALAAIAGLPPRTAARSDHVLVTPVRAR